MTTDGVPPGVPNTGLPEEMLPGAVGVTVPNANPELVVVEVTVLDEAVVRDGSPTGPETNHII